MNHSGARCVPLLLTLAGLVGPPTAQGSLVREIHDPRPVETGRVWVVDSAGGGHFEEIQGAVDAAAEGDTVLVQSGLYGGFSIVGKSLVVVAERNATLLARPGSSITVMDLGIDQRVALRGLRPVGADAARLTASDNAGLLWLEDCIFRTPVLDSLAAGSFVDCRGVVAVDCEFAGGDSYALDAHGIFAERSDLYLYDTDVTTGEHYGVLPGSPLPFGHDGASGLELRDGFLFASGCTVRGGDASMWNCPYGGGGMLNPGGSGPALSLTNSDAMSLDTTFTAGRGWVLVLVACSPVSGAAVVQSSSTLTTLSGPAHRLSAPTPLREGEDVTLTVEGVAGELAFLHDTRTPEPVLLPMFLGPLYSLAPSQILPVGTLPGSGTLMTTLTIGDLAVWRESLAVYSQGIFLGSGGGDNFAGNPTAVVVLDDGVQPIFTDCDGNLVEDIDDVALGTAQDCNANGIPDDCDVASGASGDCNSNGLADECEKHQQIQKLQPSTTLPFPQNFAWTVDIEGDTAVVGSESDPLGNQAVHLYVRSALGVWPATETAQLVSSDPDEVLYSSAVIGPDTILTRVQGPVFYGLLVWERDEFGSWPTTETTRLTTSDPNDFIQLRYHTDGDTIVVGGLDDGVKSIFVYERQPDGTWPTTETTILTTSDPPTYFNDVVVSGDTIVTAHDGRREVYVFERVGGSWPATEDAVLTGDGHFFTDHFGRDLDISGDTLIIAAQFDHQDVWKSGAAYVFRRIGGTWIREAKLRTSTAQKDDTFGATVAIDGDVAVVQIPFRDHPSDGTAVLFQRIGGVWREQSLLVGQPIASSSRFAESLAVSGSTIVCSTRDDTSGGGLGSAFVFELIDANGNGLPDTCE